ncbi:MAG: DUF3060 domain-containing protein [Deltaproteobacteria bacterium]|nr:DUF3060 domain-containing protein [Deltaproteobacteria bacterium]MCW5803824.1 DUF3060 domain-containing protein [Deltaproteobacteria bacterium]
MKRLVGLVLVLSLAPAGVAGADRVFNSGGGSHDCNKDGNVVINAGDAKYTITGACEKVSINGSSNTVTIESAKKLSVTGSENKVDVGASDKISISGSDNTVNWKKGLGADKPKVGSVGTGNKINQVK